MTDVVLEQSQLSDACGPHCGVMMTGTAQYVGHHQCSMCHPKSEDGSIN